MESNSRETWLGKAIALMIASAVSIFGIYCFFAEELHIPSRISTVEQLIIKPDTYFVGAGLVMIGLSIGVTNLIKLKNVVHRNLCLSAMTVGILLLLFGV